MFLGVRGLIAAAATDSVPPSPLEGEGGEDRRSEPGEGSPPKVSSRENPSPASPLSASAPSPSRGEANGVRGATRVDCAAGVLCPSSRSHRYCATLVS